MIVLLVIGITTILVMALLVLAVGLARAPDGYEDGTGFHRGEVRPPRLRRDQPTIGGEPLRPVNVGSVPKLSDAIISIRESPRRPIVAPKRMRPKAKPKTRGEEDEPPTFGSSGGTAISDSKSPFPEPPETDDPLGTGT